MEPLQLSFPSTAPQEHPAHLTTQSFPTCVGESLNLGCSGPKHGLLMWRTKRPALVSSAFMKAHTLFSKNNQQKWETEYVKTEGRTWRLDAPAIGHCSILLPLINSQALSSPSFCVPLYPLSTNTHSLDFSPLSLVFPFPRSFWSKGNFQWP